MSLRGSSAWLTPPYGRDSVDLRRLRGPTGLDSVDLRADQSGQSGRSGGREAASPGSFTPAYGSRKGYSLLYTLVGADSALKGLRFRAGSLRGTTEALRRSTGSLRPAFLGTTAFPCGLLRSTAPVVPRKSSPGLLSICVLTPELAGKADREYQECRARTEAFSRRSFVTRTPSTRHAAEIAVNSSRAAPLTRPARARVGRWRTSLPGRATQPGCTGAAVRFGGGQSR